MPAVARNLSALALLAVAAAGCNEIGYVELKSVPATMRGPALYLDSERVERPKDGITVLRQGIGTRRLQAQFGSGEMAVLCDIVVRKDRITTVTVSMLERPPRCQCARSGSGDAKGRRLCIG